MMDDAANYWCLPFGEEHLVEIVVVSCGMQLLFDLCDLFGKRETIAFN